MSEYWQYAILGAGCITSWFVGRIMGSSKSPPTDEEIDSVYEENRRLVENNKVLVYEASQLKDKLYVLENCRAELKEWVVGELDNARPDSKVEAALEAVLEYMET